MISPELRARIRRLFYGEHWKIGTIAAELGVHHDAVERAVEPERFTNVAYREKALVLDPYKDFVRATLEQYARPPLPARQPQVREEEPRHDHQSILQGLEHHLPECRMRHRSRRACRPPCRRHQDRGQELQASVTPSYTHPSALPQPRRARPFPTTSPEPGRERSPAQKVGLLAFLALRRIWG